MSNGGGPSHVETNKMAKSKPSSNQRIKPKKSSRAKPQDGTKTTAKNAVRRGA